MHIRAGAMPSNGAVGKNRDNIYMRQPLIHVMADHDDRFAIKSQFTRKGMDGRPPRGIEPGRRLIENQNRGVHSDRARDGDPSRLSSRQIQGITIEKVGRYTEFSTRTRDHTGDALLRDPGVTGTERDLVIHRIEEKLRLGTLKRNRHDRRRRLTSGSIHRTRIAAQQASAKGGERGFTGAGPSRDKANAARIDREGAVGEYRLGGIGE